MVSSGRQHSLKGLMDMDESGVRSCGGEVKASGIALRIRRGCDRMINDLPT